MIVSSALRLLCLFLVSIGLCLISFEVVLWASSTVIQRLLALVPVRRRERLLCLSQLAPLICAIAFSGLFWMPRYVRGETNLAPERVGWLCIVLAAGVSLWFSFALLRGLRLALRTIRFQRACSAMGRVIESTQIGTPIIALPESSGSIALIGLLKPMICIPRSLIDGGVLTPEALAIVLEHESSHAVQLDNWKLLLLSSLPTLNLRRAGGLTGMRSWQITAEWAADEDAVRDDPSRALLLAETLVACSRQLPRQLSSVVATMFLSGGRSHAEPASRNAELAARIDHLLFRRPVRRGRQRSLLALLVASVVGVIAGLSALAPNLHQVSEYLLHLG